MKPTAVLVLAGDDEQGLVDAILQLGLSVLTRETMDETLRTVRHESLAAIVLDRKQADVDPLEFALNVRDVDKETHILVIGESPPSGDDDALRLIPHTFLLSRGDTAEQVAEGLAGTLKATQG